VAAPDASLAIDYGTTFMEEDMIVLQDAPAGCRMQPAFSAWSWAWRMPVLQLSFLSNKYYFMPNFV
jgi:hypothetical protein